MTANLITLFRIAFLFSILVLLDKGGFTGHIFGIFLILLLIGLDAVDGIVARKLNETSEFGSVFDIVVDRIIENCIWIYFASKGIISFWIPVIVLTRGFITDAVRNIALSKGMTAFGSRTMQKSRLGIALVSSRASRGLYGFSKILSFVSLVVLSALNFPESRIYISQAWLPDLISWCYILIYFTVAFCIVRGIPVIFDSRDFLRPKRALNKS